MSFSGNFTLPQFLWIRRKTFKHESAWMAVQRFMYLNGMQGEDLCYLIRCLLGPRRSLTTDLLKSSTPWEDLRLDGLPFTINFCNDLKTGSAELGIYSNTRLTPPRSAIRYCPSCLRRCFHWKFFELPAVLRCPFHDETLLTACVRCGRGLAKGLFVPSEQLAPLQCSFCHQPFVDEVIGRQVIEGFPEAELLFTKETGLLARAVKVNVKASLLSEFNLKSAAASKFFFNCSFKATYPLEKPPIWLFNFELTVGNLREPPGSKNPIAPEIDTETVNDRLLHLSRIYKSIGRSLAKSIQAICGHRRHAHLQYGSDYVDSYAKEYFLRLRHGGCPCCAVLDWWKARLAFHFGLLKYFSKVKHGIAPLSGYREWLIEMLPTTPNDAAFAASSIFSSLSLRMLGMLGGHNDEIDLVRELYGDSIMDPKGAHIRSVSGPSTTPYGYLELHLFVPRYFLNTDTVTTKVHEIECDFRIPLHAALAALRLCHVEQSRGFLWDPGNRPLWSESARPSDSPHWYEDLATDANHRFWSANATNAAMIGR